MADEPRKITTEQTDGRPPLLIIAGPTAVGKSEIAVHAAKKLGGEVVSADSMQVYRHMDIGSAKTTLEEMLGVPHHLIDVADPREEFHVARYRDMAEQAVAEIYARGHLPVLCGGTGFYIQAVLRGIDFTGSGPDEALRAELNAYADRKGNDALFEILRAEDPVSAGKLHPNNRKRVIRAIEFFRKEGRPIADQNEKESRKSDRYDALFYVITDDRAALYRTIEARIGFMLEAGLVDEVRYLLAMGCTPDLVSMQGIGYKETAAYLGGALDYDSYVALLKKNTRHYAKRQLTWFRREHGAIWIDRRDYGRDSRAVADAIADAAAERWNIAPAP